ncbi:MAG: hypothetical protein JEZ01_04140 [Labilibaculum sp.]|nr:hypothetical protein [Labilibaculum sp.]MBI9056943.1 hypothetical protein [Labilibaculum sp.]
MRLFVTIISFSFLASVSFGQTTIQKEACAIYSLFEDDEPIEICLKGNIRKLFSDRNEKSAYYPILFSYKEDGLEKSMQIKVKTRGNFRKLRENCTTPPLLLNFDSLEILKSSLFQGQNKLKLVTHCKDDKYVLREYLVYKIYQLITPNSFQVRLVKTCFEDRKKGKKSKPKLGILLEDQNCMTQRNESKLVKRLNINPIKTDRELFLQMAVFQFLIGNTDWSIQFLHNIKLISGNDNAALVPVPYDFDHAGIVYTPYALPAEELRMKSVRERRYRGYCIDDMKEFTSTFQLFNEIKVEIYEIYQSNTMLEKNYQKVTLKYLDEFYDIINDKKKSKRAFQYPCNPYGTGNVVIQGMKKKKPKK